jgi:TorA maturation chaperone TorD
VTEVAESADAETAASEKQARADVYALLGKLLASAPSRELLEGLRSLEPPASETGDDIIAAWSLLKQAAARAEAAPIEEEYQEIFVGVVRGELMPYGSWYVTGFLMEKPLAELRLDLKRLGFERRAEVKEPEDHAAALCETMALMAGSGEFSFDMERQFFEKHIAPWMGRFFRDLTSARSANFYRAVGLLGERFLEVEQTYFSMLV